MGTKRKLSSINSIILHCAATPNGRADTAVDIDQWHKARDFERDLSIAPEHQSHLKHIGYHYVIELDGQIILGRPLMETGAHCSGRNEKSVGICLIGTDKFTVEQWQSLTQLVENLIEELTSKSGKNSAQPSDIEVTGHNDLSDKFCPGFSVAKWFRTLNPEAVNILSASDSSSIPSKKTQKK